MLDIAEERPVARRSSTTQAIVALAARARWSSSLMASGTISAGGVHGFNAFQLIEHLYPNEDAIQWARAWFDRHSGVGGFVPGESGPADDFAEVEATAVIKTLCERAGAIDDTPGYIFVTKTRDLLLVPEDAALLRWAPNYRGAEGVLIAPMTDDAGNLVRLMLTFVTADGLKSPHTPCRITIRGAKRPGLVRFGPPGPKAIECEGLERAWRPAPPGPDMSWFPAASPTSVKCPCRRSCRPSSSRAMTIPRDRKPIARYGAA